MCDKNIIFSSTKLVNAFSLLLTCLCLTIPKKKCPQSCFDQNHLYFTLYKCSPLSFRFQLPCIFSKKQLLVSLIVAIIFFVYCIYFCADLLIYILLLTLAFVFSSFSSFLSCKVGLFI